MSLLTEILHRVTHGRGSSSSATAPHEAPPPQPAVDGAATQAGVNTEVLAQQASSNANPTGRNVQEMHDSAGGSAAATSRTSVDTALSALARRKSSNLDWQGSIVDLLQLLDLDSGPETRKKLADELGYAGDRNDADAMDAWTHKEVMRTLNAHMG